MDQTEEDDFDHTEIGLDEMIERVNFGKRIKGNARNPSSGFGLLLEKARDGYITALKTFTDLDLAEPNGFQRAMVCQSEMKRYTQMVEWVNSAVDDGLQAELELKMRRDQDQENRGRNEYYGVEQPRTDTSDS